MSKSDLTMNPTGTTGARMAGRNILLAMLAAVTTLVAFVVMPAVANANVGLGATGGDRSGSAPNPLDFGNRTPGNLPSQYTIYLYNDSSGISGQSSANNFTVAGTGYRRNGGDCGGTATGTSWTTNLDVGLFGSSKSCSIVLELQAGTPKGAATGTISFTSNRSIENGNSRTLTGTITDEVGSVIRTYDASNNEITSTDFGGVAIGDFADRVITLKNTGSVAVANAARAISGSGTFSIQGTTCGASLPIVSSCTVTVRYSPTATGTDSGSLDFTSTSGHTKSVSLTGEGFTPVADMAVTPMSHDYGTAASGYFTSQAFTATNQGNTTLDLAFALDGGTDPAVFYRDGGTCGATLAVGASCTMIVKFDPDVSGPALQTGSFTITGSTPLVPGLPVDRTVTVEGTRVAPAASIEPRNTAGSVAVSSHDFGAVALGGTGSYTFNVANTGNIPVPGIAPSLSGGEAGDYAITGNTCGSSIPRDTSCTVTISVSPSMASQRRATLTLTPGNAAITAAPKTVNLTTSVSGIQIKNDITDNYQSIGSQKRWLETPTVNPGGALPADIVRVAFEVETNVATDIDGVEIAGSTTTNDSAPGSGFQNIADLLGGSVTVERKPGSTRSLVTAAVPLSVTNMGVGNGQYGFENGTDWQCAISIMGGTMKSDNRRVWFRIRGSGGQYTPAVGSVVRFVSQNYGCPNTQGPGMLSPRIVDIDGVAQPNNTTTANAQKNQPVTINFTTRSKSDGAILGDAGTVGSINLRIRNAKTGDLYRISGGSYQACARPCTADAEFNNGARVTFPTDASGAQTVTMPGIPSRGRWILEGSLRGTDQDLNRFYQLGVLRINDAASSSPTVTFGGSLGARPNTDSPYTISANVSDPADPVNALDSQGGRVQVIEWDLDGDHENGPLGDGFEFRSEGDPSSGVTPFDLTQAFSTTGKTPGPYTIRARVTDNGSILASDSVAQTRIFEFNTTINSHPQPLNDIVYLEADQAQPADVEFRADDADNDAFQVEITPDGANDGTLGGNMSGPVGDNTKPYTWAADYTGTDTFDFIPTDDHLGTGPAGVLTVKVRPNTTIDSSTFPDVMLHPDAGNPATRFLGSTTSTDAAFEFSSPQNPIESYDCKLTNDGDIVSDWSECSDDVTGDISFSDLADGLYKLEVRAVNADGDADGTPAFRTWRVDNTGPESEVRVGPPSNLPNQQPRLTNDTTPSYIFRATASERSLQQYVTYECRVMWGPVAGVWTPCGAPSDTQGSHQIDLINGNPDFGFSDPLTEGTYEIQVRATDEVGNLGPDMVEQFTIDTTAPETALASGPEGLINTRNLEYVLGSSQGQSTFRCMVVGDHVGVVVPMGPCPGSSADGSRPSFTVPADDTYTLTAIAVDPAQNADPTPLLVEFDVDATEPETTMDPQVEFGDGPTLLRRTQSRKVDVTFSGTDARQLQGFQCRIDSADDAAWQLCSSVQRFGGLSDGDHKVEIRAKDQAGNVDSTPEVLEWVVDLTPPVTSFTQQPAAISNDADPVFEFQGNEAIASSVCSLDGAVAVACISPVTLADLGITGALDDGLHHLSVKSTDIAGNVELTVATASWRQDTVDPAVEFTSKPAAFTPLGDADFAWDVKDGAPQVLAPEADAECALDPVDKDNIDPGEWVSCEREMTIAEADNVNGPHFLAVRAIDQAGNVSAIASHEWTVLGAKPNPPVVDDSSPVDGATTRVGTAYFAFSHELDGTGALDGLFCSLDGGTQTRCDGNYGAEGLSDGDHTFKVVAKDIAGNVSDPTTVSWSVQRGAPVTQIDFGPNGPSKQKAATFQFSADKPGTFECRIDGGAWEACSSPVELEELADGSHSFSVRAVSTVAPVGVKDPTPPSRAWTVDTAAPEVSITSAPTGQVVSYSGSVEFNSPDPDAGFQCKLGEGLFDACSSPWQLTGLSAGEQVVTVRAVDPAGNVSAEPAVTSWRVLDPSCADGFEGTPPNCTKIPAVEGPGIHALSTGGKLSLATLGEVDLPQDQVKLDGKIGADGRWFVPADGVEFKPVVQSIDNFPTPGSTVEVSIAISATGDGWGKLTNGGGDANFTLPVRADVQAKLGGTQLLQPGETCALTPIKFKFTGTWNERAMTAHLEQPDVAFPTLTGCGMFKTAIDTQLELPRDDIAMELDLALTKDAEACEPPLVGTPPDCQEPTKVITLGKPVVKGPKKLKAGKKAVYKVTVANTGDTAAANAKVCLSTPKKFIKGKAKRCKTVPTVAAAGSAVVKFNVAVKKYKVKKAKKVRVKATVTYKDGSGVAKSVTGKPHIAKTSPPRKRARK